MWVMQEKGIEVAGTRQLQSVVNRVWRVLTVLRERSNVERVVESRRALRWDC